MKKRILAILAAGTMLLTGCGAQNAAQSDAANSGSRSAAWCLLPEVQEYAFSYMIFSLC